MTNRPGDRDLGWEWWDAQDQQFGSHRRKLCRRCGEPSAGFRCLAGAIGACEDKHVYLCVTCREKELPLWRLDALVNT